MVKNAFFQEINGNFGFGCMRLPMNGDEVDFDQFNQMIDKFIDSGLNYFDTAHGYINGKSELAIAKCLSGRYDRSKFLLADKLTDVFFNKQEDIRPFFMNQLEWCGVEYFDFYLMHAQNKDNYKKFKACQAYETAYELKKEGYIKHLGLSFHDSADVLDMILTEHPEVEFVQIQFNYVDYEDASVQSRKVYDVCVKHNKPVVVMEPVKGGSLVNLPQEADSIFREMGDMSNASYALRFAASFPQMTMVLSGMSTLEQMEDNLSFMADFKPLDENEMGAVAKVTGIFKNLNLIPCTGCRYCVEENHCPKNIRIPDLFSAKNAHEAFHDWNAGMYHDIVCQDNGKASDCIKCGKCEHVCPQHLPIRDLLVTVAETFE